jgi:hypothetical protein
MIQLCPPDWQQRVLTFLEDHDADEVWGLMLPKKWEHELMRYIRDGQISKLLGVRRFMFSGNKIQLMEEPKEKAS